MPVRNVAAVQKGSELASDRNALQQEGVGTAALEKPFLSPSAWAVVALAAVVGGILLRVLLLGDRPLHHDESIHATLSYQWWESVRSAYKYDPTYHGPFLYTVLHWMFPLFGVGPAQARLFPLFFGFGVLLSPMLFRRFLGQTTTWIAIGALAVSPLFIYYARFLAHDMPALLFAMVALASVLHFLAAGREGNFKAERGWALLFAASLGLAFSVKATTHLYCFVFATFAFYAFAVNRFAEPKAYFAKLRNNREFLRNRAALALLALATFCLVYGAIQTTGFQNPKAFIEGLFTRVLDYWWGQHRVERVKGPATYHLRSLLLHELPIVLAIVPALCMRLWRVNYGRYALLALGGLFLATVPWGWPLEALPEPLVFLFHKAKIKVAADFFLYGCCFVFGIVATFQYLKEGTRFPALLTYWSFAVLAIYSYAGEKVPWLTVHVAFPMCLLAARFAVLTWNRHGHKLRAPTLRTVGVALAAFAIVWQLRIAYLVTFVTAGTRDDLLSQVHNSKDVRFVVDWMERVSYETGERPEAMPFSVIGQPVWAFYFHIIERGFKKFTLDANSVNGTQRFVIVDEAAKKLVEARLNGWGYRVAKLQHSGWWVPEHKPMTWGGWIGYALTHKAPTDTGGTWMWVYWKPIDGAPLTAATEKK